MSDLRIFRSDSPPQPSDVRELKAFLEGSQVEDERALQTLLEEHPQLVGILGFSEFVSEYPLYKTNSENITDVSDLRRRDRADLIAAATSPILESYRAANIIELKSASRRIAERAVGFRLSLDAAHAIEQLHEYRQWLTTIPQNRAALARLNWDIRWPSLSLIMGRAEEFTHNPGQLEEIRSHLLDRGVRLFTVDDILRVATNHVDNRVIPPQVVDWYFDSRPAAPISETTIQLVGAIVDDFQRTLDAALQDPSSLISLPYRAFEELTAEIYRRLGYHVELTPQRRDGGVDILAETTVGGVSIPLIIECKQLSSGKKVNVADVRSLYGVKVDQKAAKSVLITTGTLTADARRFVESHASEIQVFDMEGLIAQIATVSNQNRLSPKRFLEIPLREDGLAHFPDIVAAGKRSVLKLLMVDANASKEQLWKAAVEGIDWEFPVKVVAHERGWEAANAAVKQGLAEFEILRQAEKKT